MCVWQRTFDLILSFAWGWVGVRVSVCVRFCVYVTLQLLSCLFDLIAFYLDSTYVGIYCFHFYSFVITHCKPASYYALPISVGIPKWNEYFHIASHIHNIRILSFTVDTAHCFAIHRFQSCEYWNSSGCVCVRAYVYLERKTRWMKNLFRFNSPPRWTFISAAFLASNIYFYASFFFVWFIFIHWLILQKVIITIITIVMKSWKSNLDSNKWL